MKKVLKNIGVELKRCFLWIIKEIERLIVHIGKGVKDSFLHKQTKIAKYLICFSAVLHLLLSSVQIQAISQLTNQICGVVMFLFILLGFVCLFNALRLKEPKGTKLIFSILMLVLVMAAGIYLVTIYFDGLAHQKDIVSGPVNNGIVLSFIVLALYLFGLVETIVACIYYQIQSKKKKDKKEIVNA